MSGELKKTNLQDYNDKYGFTSILDIGAILNFQAWQNSKE
jgi:hypothetical protein